LQALVELAGRRYAKLIGEQYVEDPFRRMREAPHQGGYAHHAGRVGRVRSGDGGVAIPAAMSGAPAQAVGATQMSKNNALTVMDVDNIISGNFAPDVEKLASEIEASLGNPAALQAIGARIVADYGQEGLQEVMRHVEAIHAEEFSNPEAVDLIVGGPRAARWKFRGTVTKGQIAAQRLHEIYRGSVGRRKKTTKAEAIARHIDALAKLLRDEPDVIVGPILDSLLKHIKARR
jgi:hypothetical protein